MKQLRLFSHVSLRIGFLLAVFVSSALWMYFLVTIAPISQLYDHDDDYGASNTNAGHSAQLTSGSGDNQHPTNDLNELRLAFPSNLDELKQLSAVLNRFASSHPSYVLLLFSSAYLFKQTFAIPGSVFMNLLGGAIYGTWYAFLLCSLLTGLGATFCFLLSKICGRYLVEKYFASQLYSLRSRIESKSADESSRLFSILISLRLFPITPNWFLNIASPLVNIPITKFFLTVFLGLMPYNFICVQTGSILTEINSLDDVFTLKSFLLLVVVAVVFAVPAFIRSRSQRDGTDSVTKKVQ